MSDGVPEVASRITHDLYVPCAFPWNPFPPFWNFFVAPFTWFFLFHFHFDFLFFFFWVYPYANSSVPVAQPEGVLQIQQYFFIDFHESSWKMYLSSLPLYFLCYLFHIIGCTLYHRARWLLSTESEATRTIPRLLGKTRRRWERGPVLGQHKLNDPGGYSSLCRNTPYSRRPLNVKTHVPLEFSIRFWIQLI